MQTLVKQTSPRAFKEIGPKTLHSEGQGLALILGIPQNYMLLDIPRQKERESPFSVCVCVCVCVCVNASKSNI